MVKKLSGTSIFALLIVFGWVDAAFSQAAQSGAGESDHRWGFAIGLFSASGSEITVSKKLSNSTMLLMAADARWSRRDSDNEQSSDGAVFENMQRTSFFSFSLGPELRKYRSNGEKASFYMGVRPSLGWGRTDTRTSLPTGSIGLELTEKSRTTSLGLNATAGVEYLVLPSLSLSVHFRPLRFTYFRDKKEELPAGGTGFSSTRINKNYNITFAQIPAIVVRIYF